MAILSCHPHQLSCLLGFVDLRSRVLIRDTCQVGIQDRTSRSRLSLKRPMAGGLEGTDVTTHNPNPKITHRFGFAAPGAPAPRPASPGCGCADQREGSAAMLRPPHKCLLGPMPRVLPLSTPAQRSGSGRSGEASSDCCHLKAAVLREEGCLFAGVE